MKCPRDSSLLTPPETAGQKSKCDQCSGVLVQSENTVGLIKTSGIEAQRLNPNRAFNYICPNCNSAMECWVANVVELDLCASCDLIWFDAGELEKLDQNLNGEKTGKYLPETPSADDFGILQALFQLTRLF